MPETATWPPKEVQQPKPEADASSVQPQWPPKETQPTDQWPPKETQTTAEGFKPEPEKPLPKPSALFPGGTVATQYDPRNFPAGTVFPKQPAEIAPPDAGKQAVAAQAALGAAPRPAPAPAPEPAPLTPEQQAEQDRQISWIGGGGAPIDIPKGPPPPAKPIPWPTAPDDTEAAAWMGGGGAPITVTPPPTEQEKAQQQEKEAQKQAAETAPPEMTTAQVQPTQPDGQPLAGAQPQYQYSFADRVAALNSRYGNRVDLIASWRNLPPDQAAQLRDVYEAAILDSPNDEPGKIEGAWRTTKTVVGMIGGIAGLPQALAGTGVSVLQAGGSIAKLWSDPSSITPEDQANIRTVIAATELGHQGNVEMVQNIKRAWTQYLNSISGKLDTGDNMGWKQIMSLDPNLRLAAIRDKMDQEQQRSIQMQMMATGHLAPGWEWFQKTLYPVGSKAPMTPEILERDHGIKIDPHVVQNDSIFLNEATVLAPALDGLLEAPLSKAVGLGMEGSNFLYRPLSAAMKRIEPAAEWAGGKVGQAAGRVTAKAVQQTVLYPVPGIVRWWIPTGPVGRWAGEVGENVGRGIASIPRLARQNIFDPVAEAIKTRGLDMQEGTNNLLANGGAMAPLTNIISGAIKGGIYATPYMIGPDMTPEERAQALGFGMFAGGAHEALPAARDASMSSLFFRDPDKYRSLGFAPKDYGTSFGGMPFDQAHNAFVATQSARDQARINDSRGLLPNIEQYHLSNADYQAATAHLQRTINPATGETYLPQGNLRSRGFNILQDPGTGKSVILVNGDMSGLETAPHELFHSIYRGMTDSEKMAFKRAALEKNDPDVFTQWYTKRLTGRGVNWTDLPTEAGIKNGTQHYLPGLDGVTREHMIEEMGAETGAALLRGQPLAHFTTNRSLFRQLQFALGSMFEKLGINMTPAEATTVLGVKPGVAQSWILDQAMRDYFKRNPANVAPGPAVRGGGGPGRAPRPKGPTAATGGPTGGPAQRPTPPPTGGPAQPTPVPHTNNQPEIGGGSTGATTEEVDKAVATLVRQFSWNKKDAQTMVGGVSGQSAAELVLHALQERGKTAPGFEHGGFRTPQEEQVTQAPILPHPIAQHRLMQTGELVRRATFGDQLAVQALMERHGVNWLEPAAKEDADAVAMYRRKYPEEAAAQDQRLKAQTQVVEQAKAEGKPEPKAVDGNRINALRTQAESEVSSKVKDRDAAVARRHLQLVMEEHNASLPSGDTRVRAQVDPETGRTTYYGTHFDPSDPVHQWLLSRMDPEERKWVLQHQDAIANHSSLNFNYTHAARIEPGEELPTGPEREKEYEEQTAKERAAGKVKGQVGNRTALPITVGVGADGQGLVYSMATDKIITNALKSITAMRSAKMEPPYTPDRVGLMEMQQDMRRVAQNHAAGYSGDGSKPLVGTRDRPIVRDTNYVPQPVEENRAQFINMVMNARDPIAGPRVTKAGRTTAAGKAVEFAEANEGYTSPVLSGGQERVEVNPLREELERGGHFKGRELEHGYEQFRADLMRDRDEVAPALRKHGIEAEEFTHAPERRLAVSGFMPEIREGEITPEEVESEAGPQIPGSRVSFMPETAEVQGTQKKKAKAAPIVRAPSELRELTPEQRAMLDEVQKKASAALEQYPEVPLSGARYANGTADFPRADPKERLTKRQVAEYFDGINERLDFANPEHQKIMAAALTHDVLSRLLSDPESLGWYNRVIDAAMQDMGKLNPKILQDPVHNLIMRLSMAITSQNQKVHPNFESAYRAYLHWDRTGLMPTDRAYFGGGTKADAMLANFTKINELIRDHGFDGTEEILKTPMSVREIAEQFKVKVPGELQDYTSEASMMLGPKIGSFFNNLSKLYHTLTADLWFSRTMNRMAGKMKGFSKRALAGFEEAEPEGVEEGETEPLDEAGQDRGQHQLGKLRELINNGELENSNAKQRKAMLKEIRAVEAFRNDPEALDWDTAMALTPTIRDWAAQQHQAYAKSAGFNTKGKPVGTYGVKTASNLLSKNIDLNFKDLQDNPRTGTERENFRQIMRQVQDNLASVGINIEHADSQAVLWYLEQDIFARAKGRPGGSNSADYLDAAYALRQKYAGKTPDEFGKVPEPELPPEEPKTARKGKVAAMPEGPAAPRAPPERAPPWIQPPPPSPGQKREEEELPAMLTERAAPPEPTVRRGLIIPPPGQYPAAPPLPQPSLQPPSAEQPSGDQTGVADFFRKRGDQPITSENDPRLTTVNVGGQSWRVNKEAAPAFQGFLNELAVAGAPIRSDGGWVYREKVGASGISEHAFGGAIDLNQEGRNQVTPAFRQWLAAHPGALAAAENRWHIYGGERFGDLGHFEWGGVPHQQMAGPDQETRRRTGSASAARIMREEGPSDTQDGIPEIFGFRRGQDPEYESLLRARAAGNESEVQRIAARGFVDRAVSAGSKEFADPSIKAQIMSLAHMRGAGGARDILQAVATGKIDNSGSIERLDPEAVATINRMPRTEVMRRLRIAREAYDKIIFGSGYWDRYGRGLSARYDREREFYTNLT